jgi:hypothetical protein
MEEDIKNAGVAGVGVGVGVTTQEAVTLDKNEGKKGQRKNKNGGAVAPVVVDEVAEEENYGEEVPEDEDEI